MTLLAPITALIAAGVAIPGLLALYFLKLRRRPVKVSSTMLWEEAVHDLQVNAPFRMIKPSWLLLLHLLIIVLLLLALGRPAIESGGPPGSKVFFIIDRSASMSAEDMPDDGSRLEAAKARAIEVAEKMSRGGDAPNMTVIAFASEAVVVAPPTRRAAAVRGAVESIEPTDQPGDPAVAVELVESLTSGSFDESGGDRPKAILFSDGGDAIEPLTSTQADIAFELVGPDPELAPRGNVGIVAVNGVRDFDDPGLVRLFLRLVNTGRGTATVQASVLRGEDVLARAPITVPGTVSRSDGAPLGEMSRTIEIRDTEGGPITVALGRNDALASDDTAWLVLPPPAVPRVMLVAPQNDEGEAAPYGFLRDVIDALRTRDVRVVSDADYAGFNPTELRRFDLIVFDRVTPARDPPVASLSFGASLRSLLGARPEPRERRPASGTEAFVSWTRSHPIMQDLALDAVQISRWVALPGAGSASVSVRELALGSEGPMIIEVEDQGVQRLVVAYPLQASNWVVDVSFAIFMATSFEYLSARGGDRGVWFGTSEPAEALGVRSLTGTARLASVQGGPLQRELSVNASGPAVPVGVVERAGLYGVDTGTDRGFVAVNLANTRESSIVTRTADEISVGGDPAPGVDDLSGPREIWTWFILGAGVLLLVEWLIYGLRMKA